MNADEALVLLTKTGLVDPRMKRTDVVEQADMAEAWAAVLQDVDLGAAVDAMRWFYRASSGPIMPADIVTAVGQAPDPSRAILDVTAERLATERRLALEAAGVSEEEFAAHQGDETWIAAHFKTRELEA